MNEVKSIIKPTEFLHELFGKLKVVTIKGVTYFVGKEVADKLGYVKTGKAYTHCKGLLPLNSSNMEGIKIEGIHPASKLITEGDMYRLIIKSTKKEALEFESWVMDTILPSVRNNGAYITNQETMSPEEVVAHALIAADSIIKEKSKIIESQNKLIGNKNYPISLSKLYSGKHKVVQVVNMTLESLGYIEKRFDSGVRNGWTLTTEGEELGYASQISKSSVFWTPEVRSVLPSELELTKTASNLGLSDFRH